MQIKKEKLKIKENKNKSIFKTFLIYFISLSCFVLFNILINGNFIDIESDCIRTLIIQFGIIFLLPFCLYSLLLKQTPKKIFKTCNFFRINIWTIIISILIGIVIFFLNIIASSFFSGLIASFGYVSKYTMGASGAGNISWVQFLQNVVLIALIPAFCEEFLHRGLLLQGTKHMGFKKSIVISAILFALIHLNIEQSFSALVIGFILGFVAVVSKNIWPAIIIHFVNNFTIQYLSFAESNNLFGGSLFGWINSMFSNSNAITLFFTSFIILSIIAIILMFLIMQLYKFSILRNVQKALDSVYKKNVELNKNKPIFHGSEQNRIIQEILETNTTLNLDLEAMKNPIEMVMPKQREIYITSLRDRAFYYATLILSGLITIFTFVWGLF